MLWTMILVSVLIPVSSQAGGVVNPVSIPGFASKEDCIIAGNMIELPKGGDWHKVKSIFTCVPMGEK